MGSGLRVKAAMGSGLSIDLFAIRLLDSLHGAHGKGMEANLLWAMGQILWAMGQIFILD